MIHIDFSENWTTKHFEEVQAMHFGASKTQITLHTGVYYLKGAEPVSFCTISPDNRHNPEAIWAHLDPILKYIKSTHPNIDQIHFYSRRSNHTVKTFFFTYLAETYTAMVLSMVLGLFSRPVMASVLQMASEEL